MLDLSLRKFLVIGVLFVIGCSTNAPAITTGMNMRDAAESMAAYGLSTVEMQFAGPHQAFQLPDGRCVVLLGDATVDAIEVISNPHKPKSQRMTQQVQQFAP